MARETRTGRYARSQLGCCGGTARCAIASIWHKSWYGSLRDDPVASVRGAALLSLADLYHGTDDVASGEVLLRPFSTNVSLSWTYGSQRIARCFTRFADLYRLTCISRAGRKEDFASPRMWTGISFGVSLHADVGPHLVTS